MYTIIIQVNVMYGNMAKKKGSHYHAYKMEFCEYTHIPLRSLMATGKPMVCLSLELSLEFLKGPLIIPLKTCPMAPSPK